MQKLKYLKCPGVKKRVFIDINADTGLSEIQYIYSKTSKHQSLMEVAPETIIVSMNQSHFKIINTEA